MLSILPLIMQTGKFRPRPCSRFSSNKINAIIKLFFQPVSQGEQLLKFVKLSIAQVEHTAQLAQLALTDDEKELFREQLSCILEYAERLQQLDTEAIPPNVTVLPVENVMREDEIQTSLSLADVLANAPAAEQTYFRVPVVLEGEG
jgi:aspartyl-tRNA(Asn)/glutamyl-tRNA(Gln) amidotransferase subunit C